MSFNFGFKKLRPPPEDLPADRRRALDFALGGLAIGGVSTSGLTTGGLAIGGLAIGGVAISSLRPSLAAESTEWTAANSARWLEQQGLKWSLRGEGLLRWFGLTVYQGRLWSAEGFEPLRWENHSFALELVYARSLAGARIAETSLELIQAQRSSKEGVAARDAAWLRFMRSSFPDVQAGDRIVGLYGWPQAGCRFVHNLRLSGETNDLDFARAFFAIWLDPKTREPGLGKALLGQT